MDRAAAHRSAVLAAFVVSLSLFVAGCGDSAVGVGGPDAASDAGGTKPRSTIGATSGETGSKGLSPEDLTRRRAVVAAERVKSDEYARGYLKSFRSRVYSAGRDDRLTYAEATLTVRTRNTDERESRVARYTMIFDRAKRDRDEPAYLVRAIEGHERMPENVETQLYQVCKHCCEGPGDYVVQYEPPIRLQMVPSMDGKSPVVRCPPHKGDRSVSYNFDERQLVVVRGTIEGSKRRVTKYAWREYKGRYLLETAAVVGHPTTIEFGYDDNHGPALMTEARLSRGQATFDVRFDWVRVDATPRKPPQVEIEVVSRPSSGRRK